MARFFDSTYDPRHDSASSGSEVSDLVPERSYATDLRRVPEDERKGVEEINDKQNSVKKYFSAARTANKYKQQASIDEPTLRGRTPRSEASIDGVELPSLGDTYRASGTVGYAKKPQPQSGRFTGFD